MAEDLPALVTGLIVAVLDIAVFAELYLVAQAAPWILTPHGVWMGAAIATALGGAILMLCQRSLKRLLVLSTVEDIGFLLFGVAFAGTLGMSGAMLGATVHALAKALLFICISTPEADGVLDGSGRGLASRYPLSATGFLFGMLAMLGVPPMLGFAARWRLYETATQVGPAVLLAFVLSSALALIAYTLALTRFWWGPPESDGRTAPEPLPLRGTVLILIVLLLAAGLWPNMLQTLIGGVR
jgi:multicomponent Na+:H+ antiporter subunit D